ADMVHASADVRLYDAGALVSAPLPGGEGAVAAAARYSYTGAAISLLSSSVSLAYWDYQLRVDRRLGPLRLTLLALGSSDALSYQAVSMARNDIALGFHRLGLRAALPIAGGILQAGVALGVDHSGAPLESFPVNIDSRSVIPRLAFRRSTARTDLEVGFDGELQRFAPQTAIMRPGALDLITGRDARMLAG